MPVTNVTKDLDNRTLTVEAEFAAPVERVWQLYADPRQLEKIWGPPGYPATVVEHSLTPGGRVHYYMTSPEGEKFPGWWGVTAVDEPNSFEFDDGFAADMEFNPAPDMPVAHCVYRFEPNGSGTKATYISQYPTAEGLQQVLEMGMEQGLTLAVNQIDELLAS